MPFRSFLVLQIWLSGHKSGALRPNQRGASLAPPHPPFGLRLIVAAFAAGTDFGQGIVLRSDFAVVESTVRVQGHIMLRGGLVRVAPQIEDRDEQQRVLCLVGIVNQANESTIVTLTT